MIATDIVTNLLPWSLQVAAIVIIASLLPWLFRLDAAGVRYVYWRTVALLCLALPWMQPYRAARGTAQAAAAITTSTADSVAAAVTQTVSQLTWGTALLWVLAIGIVVRFGWLAVGLFRLRTLRRKAHRHKVAPIDSDLQKILETHSAIRYVADLEQPITFGLFKPIVMLPESLSAQPREIQQAVLGHELLHVKRRDWAWLIVEEIAVCLFWFHPASWWVASQIQHAREEVVDELAIQLTGRRKAYVEALLTFSDATSVVPTAAFARRRHLFRRIALVSKESVMSSRRIVATCAAMALVVATGSWYAVFAFPLQSSERTNSLGSLQPGPLELKAHAVTAENPIPRRVYYEAPVLPASAASARGGVGIKVTLDEVGRVAEARMVDFAFKGNGLSIEASEVDLKERGVRALEGYARADNSDRTLDGDKAWVEVVNAAVTSVRAWRYDPPYQAPLTFTVQVPFGEPIMEFKPRSEDALRVGGAIKAPKKIRDVRPVYPPIALAANVTGVVIVEARIGADGFVESAHIVKSIPLLDQAALDAVKQWQFEPPLVNGQPTPVTMTLAINFAQ